MNTESHELLDLLQSSLTHQLLSRHAECISILLDKLIDSLPLLPLLTRNVDSLSKRNYAMSSLSVVGLKQPHDSTSILLQEPLEVSPCHLGHPVELVL